MTRTYMLGAALALAGCAAEDTASAGGNSAGARTPGDAVGAVIEFRSTAPADGGLRGLHLQGPAVLPVLVFEMTSEETWAAMQASEEAVQLGGDAVPALTALLRSKSPRGRGWAAWALGEIGPAARGAREALVEARSDPELHTPATEALRKIGE